jgi:chromosomal replication initiation ATPase DnaA
MTESTAKRIVNDYNRTDYSNRIKVRTVVLAERFLSGKYDKPKKPKRIIVNNNKYYNSMKQDNAKPKLLKIQDRESCLNRICEYICEKQGLQKSDIYSPSRIKEIVRARQLAYYLSYELGVSSFKGLARHFKYDHSTVMNGRFSIKSLTEYDARFNFIVTNYQQDIKEIIKEFIL